MEELYCQLNESQKEVDSLKQKLEQMMTFHSKVEFNLAERVKELNCHYSITEIMMTHGLSVDEVCRRIADILPAAWQFPDLLEASIKVGDNEFNTPGFKDSVNKLSQDLKIGNRIIGKVEVCYPENKYSNQGPVFLSGEERLLFAVSLRIGDYLENKENEIKLTRSEGKYRSLVENISDIIYEIAGDGTILYVSPAIKRVLGYSHDEITGKNFLNYVHEADRVLLRGKLIDLEKRDYSSLEYRLICKCGETKWVRSSTLPVYENGTIVGGAGSMTDITLQKEIEKEIRESESLYKSILVASPDVITITDIEGKILFSSPRSLEMFGYENSEILNGHNLLEFITPEFHSKAVNGITSMLQKNPLGAEEYIGIKSDGTLFDMEVNGEVINDENGQPARMVFIVRDVSKRKQTENQLKSTQELYRKMVETINDVIFEVAADGTVNYVSPAIERILGYRPEDLTGENFFTFMYPDDRPVLMNALAQLAETDFSNLEYRFYKKDGDIRWVRSSTKPIFENGKLVGGRGALYDIHERKMAEMKLLKSEEKYRNIFENTQDVYYEATIEGILLEISPSIHKISKGQFCKEELIGQSIVGFYTVPEERNHFFAELFKTGSVTDFELSFRNKDGSVIPIAISSALRFNSDRQPVAVFGSMRDISERKKAQDSLAASELKYKTLFYDSPGGYLIVRDGIFIDCNHASETLIRGDRSMLLGKTPGQISPEYQLNGRKSEEYAIELIRETFEKGNNSFEWMHQRFDGSDFLAVINLSVIDYEGSPVLLVTWQDITEQRAAEEQLRKLSRAVEQSPVSIVITNLEGNIEYVNPRVSETTGYTLEELMGKNPRVLKSGETQSNEYSILWENISEGREWKGLFHNKRKNGELYWESSTIAPIMDSSGKITHYLAIKEDITEIKLSEEKIRQQNERLTAIIRAIPDLIFVTAQDGTFLEFYSSDNNKLIGSDDHVDGVNLKKIFKQDSAAVHLQKIHECLESKAVVTYEFSDMLETGFSCFEVRLAPMGMDRVLTFARDISEKRLKEDEIKKLSLAVEQSPVSIVITDLNANIEYVNPAFEETTGYKFSEVLGKNTNILKSEKTDVEVYREMWKTVTSGKEWHGEWLNKKKSGDLYWENISISPINDASGKITNFLAVKQDVTGRKEAEMKIRDLNANLEQKIEERTSQLAETNDNLLKEIEERKKAEVEISKARNDAEQANMAKSEFLSRMSHELRTPMNSILGFAQLLDMGELNKRQKKAVSHILSSGKHLLDLINEVLDISRIEAGRLSLSMESVPLSGIISETLDIIRPQAAFQGLALNFSVSDSTKYFVKADRQRLKQILLNLINNAIKYNREGGEIEVKVVKMPPVENGIIPVRISISDTGFGISPDDISKLFTPFERIGAEKSATEGTGLGLSVVKKLIDAMGGTVGVESEINKGSTFWIEMPQCDSLLESTEKSGVLMELNKGEDTSTGKVLYIEDNTSDVELVEQFLRTMHSGIKLVTSAYGSETVALAIDNRPDLILLDLNLPDLHGTEVLDRLQKEERTSFIPVIVISADAMPKAVDLLLKNGARKFLTKPLDIMELLKVIDEFVINKRP